MGERDRDRPGDAELCRHRVPRCPACGRIAAHHIVRLRADHQFHALDPRCAVAQQPAHFQRGADRRMGQAAGRVGLERQAFDFEAPAQGVEHARGIQLAVQVDAVQPVLTRERLPDALQPAAGHQRRGDGIGSGKAGLHVLGRRTFARGFVIAAGHAVGDAEGVAQHLGRRTQDARSRQRGAKLPEQCGIDPAAFHQVDAGADAKPAGQLDTEQYRFA